MIRAVIFDLDNTLYDYDKCDTYATERLMQFSTDSFTITREDFFTDYARAKELVKERLGSVGASHNRMLYMQRFLELLGQRPAVHAVELYDVYWDSFLGIMEPYPYVEPLFQRLSAAGIRIALLTDLTAHIQHRKLLRLGIAGYIDAMVTSEEAGTEKPDSGGFRFLMEKLGLAPQELLMVGDSYDRDIRGAEAAGIKGICYSETVGETIVEQCMEIIKNAAWG